MTLFSSAWWRGRIYPRISSCAGIRSHRFARLGQHLGKVGGWRYPYENEGEQDQQFSFAEFLEMRTKE